MVRDNESVLPVDNKAAEGGRTSNDVRGSHRSAGEESDQGDAPSSPPSYGVRRKGGRRFVVPVPDGCKASMAESRQETVEELHRCARFLIGGEHPDGEEKCGDLPWKIHVQGGRTYRFLAVNVRVFSDTTYVVELLIGDEANNSKADVHNAILDLFGITELRNGEEEGDGDGFLCLPLLD